MYLYYLKRVNVYLVTFIYHNVANKTNNIDINKNFVWSINLRSLIYVILIYYNVLKTSNEHC